MPDKAHVHKLLTDRHQSAFNYLYDAYAPVLYGLIIKITPDQTTACEILQESFLHIWVNIDSYDASKGRLFYWMIGITVQQCSRELRLPREALLDKLMPVGIAGY